MILTYVIVQSYLSCNLMLVKIYQYALVNYFINFMQKNNPINDKVETQALQRYIKAQFSDYHPPSLQQFLNIKKYSYSQAKALTFVADPHSQLSEQISQILESQAIYYIQSGVIELHKKQGRRWKRDIQYKQGNFFTLINYKSINLPEPQWFKLVLKAKVVISVFPIRSNYNYEWMRAVWLKNTVLSKIFFFGDPEIDIERKKYKFHEFSKAFKHEIFRRDTRIVNQGKKNQHIYIIAKGEAKLLKQLSANNYRNGQIHKNVEILYLRQGTVFGGQLFLISSKSIHSIISNHSSNREYDSKLSIKQQENEDEQQEDAITKKHKKRSKSRLSKVSVESGGYELYDPHQNISNFTIVAESANLQLFYIDIDYLVKAITQRYKINFLKMIQSTYITILRRTHQKMIIELKKEQDKMGKNNRKIETIAAKAYSSNDNHSQIVSEENQGITMKVSQIGMMGATLNHFKLDEVRKNQNIQIQKRTQLLIKQKKPRIDFKQKIEALIEKKLNKASNEEINQEQIIQDFADIFMKKNEGRTQDIEKRAQLLQKKRLILQKRGGWKPGWDQLKSQGIKIHVKRETLNPPNYLTGVNIEHLSQKIKVQCNHKIHETNKIKEQFMKIQSECHSCVCYENFQNFSINRRSMTSLGRTGYKTAEGWGKTSKVTMEQESLETVYHRMAFLSEKSKEKYNHNIHLLQVRRNRNQLERRRSAPKFY